MTLQSLPGGWVATEYVVTYHTKINMITQQRRSKYKHKVIFKGNDTITQHHEIRQWCEQMFGPGGRSKKLRWRMGWTDKDDTYYFKSSKDAMMFTLRWS